MQLKQEITEKKKQEFLLKLNVSQQIIIKTPDYDKKRKTKEKRNEIACPIKTPWEGIWIQKKKKSNKK